MVAGTLGNIVRKGIAADADTVVGTGTGLAAENESGGVECYTERLLLTYCGCVILVCHCTASANNTSKSTNDGPTIWLGHLSTNCLPG